MIRAARSARTRSGTGNALSSWAHFNGIGFNGTDIKHIEGRGNAIVATKDVSDVDALPLITVPRSLVLSLEYVQDHAKADRAFALLLEALGESGHSTRMAILAFLLQQMTRAILEEQHPHKAKEVGLSSEWTRYTGFLPLNILPTRAELPALAQGTTLQPAMQAKMKSLRREFAKFRRASKRVAWCARHWWNEDALPGLPSMQKQNIDDGDADLDTPEDEADCTLTFDDWLQVDFIYRSRGLEFPGIGDCLVPCIDMANHAHGEHASAYYECDADGNATLLVRPGKSIAAGDEVTISYGDDKSACEMLFSYGFIPEEMLDGDARVVVLDLPFMLEDPLARAKQYKTSTTPGFALSHSEQFSGANAPSAGVAWSSDFVWCVVVNEEDGLRFEVLQTNEGTRELSIFWKEEELANLDSALREKLQDDELWPVFHLRAVVLMEERVNGQLDLLHRTGEVVDDATATQQDLLLQDILSLRGLEEKLLVKGRALLQHEKNMLAAKPEVIRYLTARQRNTIPADHDDFETEEDFT